MSSALVWFILFFFCCVLITKVQGELSWPRWWNKEDESSNGNPFSSLSLRFPWQKPKKSKVNLQSIAKGLGDDYREHVVPALHEMLDELGVQREEAGELLSFVERCVVASVCDFCALPPVIRSIVGINVLVWLAWQLAPEDKVFMYKHFTLSDENDKAWRLHTKLTNAFSHASFSHLLGNMIVFCSFGPPVLSLLGSHLFIGLVVGSAVVAGAVRSLLLPFQNGIVDTTNKIDSNSNNNKCKSKPCLGFSGVCSSLSVFFAAAEPHARLKWFGSNGDDDEVSQGQEEEESYSIFGPSRRIRGPSTSMYIDSRVYLQRCMLADFLGLCLNVLLGDGITHVAHDVHLGGYFVGLVSQSFICSSKGKMLVSRRCRNALCEW